MMTAMSVHERAAEVQVLVWNVTQEGGEGQEGDHCTSGAAIRKNQSLAGCDSLIAEVHPRCHRASFARVRAGWGRALQPSE
jgi:hypothetical protein